jgi:hypothetical protein
MQSDQKDKKYWHNKSIRETLNEFNTSQNEGLTEEEARNRLKQHGTNELTEQKGRSVAHSGTFCHTRICTGVQGRKGNGSIEKNGQTTGQGDTGRKSY